MADGDLRSVCWKCLPPKADYLKYENKPCFRHGGAHPRGLDDDALLKNGRRTQMLSGIEVSSGETNRAFAEVLRRKR